jgi:CLIP-associating protein 1/2
LFIYLYKDFLCFQVRQQAIDTLVEIYRHVGEKVRGDIAKRDIPEAK